MSKVLIWLTSGDRNKLMPGVLWGTNAKRRGWVDEVRVVVFGDSEQTVMKSDELFNMVQEIEDTIFCRHVAETQGMLEHLEQKGAKVEYVGESIAKAIADGFTVITF